MRVQNNPRTVGRARAVPSWSKADKPLTLSDYERMLVSQKAQREAKMQCGWSGNVESKLIAEYEAKIAELRATA